MSITERSGHGHERRLPLGGYPALAWPASSLRHQGARHPSLADAHAAHVPLEAPQAAETRSRAACAPRPAPPGPGGEGAHRGGARRPRACGTSGRARRGPPRPTVRPALRLGPGPPLAPARARDALVSPCATPGAQACTASEFSASSARAGSLLDSPRQRRAGARLRPPAARARDRRPRDASRHRARDASSHRARGTRRVCLPCLQRPTPCRPSEAAARRGAGRPRPWSRPSEAASGQTRTQRGDRGASPLYRPLGLT